MYGGIGHVVIRLVTQFVYSIAPRAKRKLYGVCTFVDGQCLDDHAQSIKDAKYAAQEKRDPASVEGTFANTKILCIFFRCCDVWIFVRKECGAMVHSVKQACRRTRGNLCAFWLIYRPAKMLYLYAIRTHKLRIPTLASA